MSLSRLEAHVAALRTASSAARSHGRIGPVALDMCLPEALEPPRLAPARAQTVEDDPLASLETFFASLDPSARPSAAERRYTEVHSSPETKRPDDYDELVQATVRRAWNAAWKTYQGGGSSCHSSRQEQGTMALPISMTPPMPYRHGAVTPRAISHSPGIVPSPAGRVASSSNSYTSLRKTSAAPTPVRDHPHRPASAKRPPSSYSQQHQRRNGRVVSEFQWG
jgi:hypothetical protein